MNNDATSQRLMQLMKSANVVNQPQPSASGYRYKADNPAFELVLISPTAATATALIEGSFDGATWTPVVTLSVATTTQKQTNSQVTRATGSLYALWRSTIQTVSGDATATAYVNMIG